MQWHYSDVRYDPSIRADLPYIVTATCASVEGALYARIDAHGATPDEARARAERGAAQMDAQAPLFPWKAVDDG